jgi:hypothetical protein
LLGVLAKFLEILQGGPHQSEGFIGVLRRRHRILKLQRFVPQSVIANPGQFIALIGTTRFDDHV